MAKETFSKLVNKPLNRRQFIKFGLASGAAAYMATQLPFMAEAQDGGTMVWLGHQEVAGLSPNDAGPTVQAVVIYNIMDPLVQINAANELVPILAESYEVAEDGLTYTFNLRKGVMFHDGSELTSADVKYTYDYYRDVDNASTLVQDFQNVASVETPDDYTVVVNMESVNASFLVTGPRTPIVNAAQHAELGEDIFRTMPIGTGAFKLKEWRAAEFTELEAFDDHFRGRPNVDFLRMEVVPEPSVRYIAMLTGDADSSVWPLLVEDSLSFEGDPAYRVERTLSRSVKHIILNNTIPALSDKVVRQAMLHALDRQRIIDDLWNGTAEVAHSHLTPANAYYHKTDVKQYAFDPEAANAMLDEAGYVKGDDGIRAKDGVKLSFTCTTITGDQARRPIAELAQFLFKDIGVDMQLAEAPLSTIREGLKTGEVEASLFNWTYGRNPEPDSAYILGTGAGNNFNSYSNPVVDDLLSRGVGIVDPEARREIYHEIQDIIAEDVPFLPLQYDQTLTVFSSEVGGLPDEIVWIDATYYFANEWSKNG